LTVLNRAEAVPSLQLPVRFSAPLLGFGFFQFSSSPKCPRKRMQ